jgi:site-specific DNA-methyltransferase (adenine-specific)
MVIPDSISFSSIVLGERIRSSYHNIESLADAIEDKGLIQPIVLAPIYGYNEADGEYIDGVALDAGGRRYHALKLLIEQSRWDGTLWHATTSLPGRPGFVLKGVDESTPLKRLLTEIGENLNRDDLDWRDEVKAIVRAWKLAKADADSNSEKLLMRDFGYMLGCGYMNLQASLTIHDDVIANPDRYKDVTSIRGAHAVLLKVNANELTKLLATKSLATAPLSSSPSVSIEFMSSLPENSFDHIVCDPDYGVSVERLEASVSGAEAGVDQPNISDSLLTLDSFLIQSWRLVRPNGFCVFWYDLDHHEKLQYSAISRGWRVQRWPLIWVKSDYRSNASPQSNFCKNIEYAMVCRKPNAVLAKVQMSSVFTCPSADTVKRFNHPFAKPLDLWKWIFSAVSIKGQTVYDPFLGSGTSAVAAAEFGLRPMGSEISIDHYSNAIVNIQDGYKKLIGENVRFT